MPSNVLFNLNKDLDITKWMIVNDYVMGGISTATFDINTSKNGLFKGEVSLENNGGFASVRHRFETMDISSKGYSKVQLRIKGDGKAYQFRIKATVAQRFSYIGKFETSGAWQTISIPFSTMYPAFRGKPLKQPNYSGKELTEIAFLIGNKKQETFELEIDSIDFL